MAKVRCVKCMNVFDYNDMAGTIICPECGAKLKMFSDAPKPVPVPEPAPAAVPVAAPASRVSAIPANKKFCAKCGNELFAEAVVCTRCGCATGDGGVNFGTAYGGAAGAVAAPKSDNALLNELANKVNTNGIIWLVIGVIQILLGLFVQYFLLIVGVLNIITAVSDMNYSKQLITSPVGICKRFEPLTMPIITLVYNVLFGGIIGVVGSIYYLVAIRGFVLNNKASFERIEQQYQGWTN